MGSADKQLRDAWNASLNKKLRDVETEFAIERFRKGLGLLPEPKEKSAENN